MLNICNILVGNPRRNAILGGPRCGSEDNVERDVNELGREDMGWVRLIQFKDHWQAFMNRITNL
jgi:hypothetical protein